MSLSHRQDRTWQAYQDPGVRSSTLVTPTWFVLLDIMYILWPVTILLSTMSTPLTGYWRGLCRKVCRDPDNFNRLASSSVECLSPDQEDMHLISLDRTWQAKNWRPRVRVVFNKTYFFYLLNLHSYPHCKDTIPKIWNIYSQKGTARPQLQFLHSCFCEWFIYSHNRSAYSAAGK